MTPAPWLTIVGMGDDGLDGLSPAAKAVLDGAAVLVGGHRLLDRVPGAQDRIPWTTLDDTLQAILARRGTPVTVVATGDPMHYGLGATLARHIAPEEMRVLPAPSAFSLAAARLGWPVQDCLQLTAHGRPVAALGLHFAPGRKLLILAADRATPAAVAALLTREGYGPSRLVALSHMGGADEARAEGTADRWAGAPADLNTLAVECRLAPGARPRSRAAGLPDDAFEHDGQITKREVRAVTLAALGPWPGARLWDVGAGSGSVGIEWMRAAAGARAVAVERDAMRAARIARNALALGVPGLEVTHGAAPEALAGLPDPDAVFVGGGVSVPGVLETCWERLSAGGRLVANAVTVEAEARLLALRARIGGDLKRIAISRTKPAGALTLWDAHVPVTQLVAEKGA